MSDVGDGSTGSRGIYGNCCLWLTGIIIVKPHNCLPRSSYPLLLDKKQGLKSQSWDSNADFMLQGSLLLTDVQRDFDCEGERLF